MANTFGDVLRGMGSVLNPQVNQQVMQEQENETRQQQALQQMMLQKMMSGVESGAIDPSRLPPGLQGMVGPSLQAQEKKAQLAQSQKADAFYRNPQVQELLSGGKYVDVARLAIGAGIERDPVAAMKAAKDLGMPKITSLGGGAGVIQNADGSTSNITPPAKEPTLPPIGQLQQYRSGLIARGLPTDHPDIKQVDAAIEKATAGPTESSSALGRLISERDALPADHPNRATYNAAIEAAKKNPTGGASISVDMGLGKAGQTKVDTGLLDTTEQMMAMSRIESMFKPEYQRFAPRLSAAWSSIKESAGAKLDAKDKAFATDFYQYKRNAIGALNDYIKRVTGAAMSEAEAERLTRGIPNPGQGIFDGDGPTEFKAKLDDVLRQTKMSIARYTYIKKRGMAIGDIPLDKMPGMINQRGKDLEQQYKQVAPNATPEQIAGKVRDTLANEFGLVR
jgi:hypothetical protein